MPPGSTKSRSTSPSSSGKYSPPTPSPTSPLSSNAWQHSRIDPTAPPNHSVGNTPAPTSTNTSPDSTTTPLPHDPRRINGQDGSRAGSEPKYSNDRRRRASFSRRRGLLLLTDNSDDVALRASATSAIGVRVIWFSSWRPLAA